MNTVRVSHVLRGIAAHLHAAGVGVWTGPEEVAPAGKTLIALKRLPPSPDRALAISVYDLDLDVELPNTGVMVQILSRAPGAADEVDDLADDALEAMHAVHHATWGALRVARCVHESTAPLGADGNGREERSDNYRIVTQGGTP
ncbi:hypothetical protein CHO01_25210 [Cellulomonas hominis]|uniref:DUF3168 domain-containing protein n=1 Tax=Cellulomonas hominis TaxID=156981 RepID=A0A511FDS5_9CELL|nr:minor capsid protein [Cellulomonas hominis]MBB5472487.1 hypothetical protein [Cellulomonas hominis]NKY05533.1 hypothetical protein [Cellulomonas hominis]GEL47405.1 hypothetical protein CHO01_25210 [Cellulomonas hominis]